MNKSTQFKVKENYVSPLMKIAALRTRRTILTGSITGSNDSLEVMNSRDVTDWTWDEDED